MEHFYKNRRIEITPWLDSEHWVVNIFIFYQQQATAILVTFALDKRFATRDEAIEAGLCAAMNWIDGQVPSANNFRSHPMATK